MINRLEIENFFSVNERQIIDLTVGKKVPDELGRLMPVYDGADDRAPGVVAIYGANASGKTQVLRAIRFLTWFIQWSFAYPASLNLPYSKFATKKALSAPTRLSMTFAGKEDPVSKNESRTCPYVYTLELVSVSHGAEKLDQVRRESLYYRPGNSSRMIRIFDRDREGKIKTGSMINLGRQYDFLERVLRSNASMISTLAQMNEPHALAISSAAGYVWSNVSLNNPDLQSSREFRFSQPSLFDDAVPIKHDYMPALRSYKQNAQMLDALNRDISRIDLGIDGFTIADEKRSTPAAFTHASLDHPIKMQMESTGTQEFVRIYPMLYKALESGGVAVVELDGSIHPAVLSEILRWFRDPDRNPLGAQLWMSSHDVSLLGDLLKEEVLICERTANGATQVYGLRDIRGIRRDENFMQNYLGGVYGGIPNIG